MPNTNININAKSTGDAAIKNMAKNIKTLGAKFETMDKKVKGVNKDFGKIGTRIGRVNTNLEGLNKNIGMVSSQFAKANGMFNNVNKQLTKFGNRVEITEESMKAAKKSMDKLVRAEEKLSKVVKDTQTILKKQTKEMEKNKKAKDKNAKSTKKAADANDKMSDKIAKANKETEENAKKQKRNIGVTGLAFGFVGAAAGGMADTVIDHVRRMVDESSDLLSDMNRSILFNADAWDEFGNVDFLGKNKLKNQRLTLATDFKLPIADVIDFTREVDKAIVGVEDANAYYEAVARFRHVEPNISGESIASDLVTIRKSSQREVKDIANIMFAYGNASKLGFTQAAKAMAFGSDAMRSYNTDLETFAAVMIQATNIAPALAGSAGRAISTMGVDLLQQRDLLEQKYNIRLFDELPDGAQKTRDFKDVLLDVIDQINRFKLEGKERDLAEFMDELKLEKTARRLLTGFAAEGRDAMDDAIEEIKSSVKSGQLDKFVENQLQQPFEKYVTGLKIEMDKLKLSFGSGFFKGLNKLDAVLAKIPWEKFREFMMGFGEGLAEMVTMIEPLIKEFNDFSKSMGGAANLGKMFAKVIGHAVVGLKLLGTIAPIVGVTLGLHYVGSMLSGIKSTGDFVSSLMVAKKHMIRFALAGGAILLIFGYLRNAIWAVGDEADKVNTVFGTLDFGSDFSNRIMQYVADLGTFAGIGAMIGAQFGGPLGALIGAGIGAAVALIKNGMQSIKDAILDADISGYIEEKLFDKDITVKSEAYWLSVANEAQEGLDELKKKYGAHDALLLENMGTFISNWEANWQGLVNYVNNTLGSNLRSLFKLMSDGWKTSGAHLNAFFKWLKDISGVDLSGLNIAERIGDVFEALSKFGIEGFKIDLEPLGKWLGNMLGLGLQSAWNNWIDSIIGSAYETFWGLGEFMSYLLSGMKFDSNYIDQAKEINRLMLENRITADEYEKAIKTLNKDGYVEINIDKSPHGIDSEDSYSLGFEKPGKHDDLIARWAEYGWTDLPGSVSTGVSDSTVGSAMSGIDRTLSNSDSTLTSIETGIGTIASDGSTYHSELLQEMNELSEKRIEALKTGDTDLADKLAAEMLKIEEQVEKGTNQLSSDIKENTQVTITSADGATRGFEHTFDNWDYITGQKEYEEPHVSPSGSPDRIMSEWMDLMDREDAIEHLSQMGVEFPHDFMYDMVDREGKSILDHYNEFIKMRDEGGASENMISASNAALTGFDIENTVPQHVYDQMVAHEQQIAEANAKREELVSALGDEYVEYKGAGGSGSFDEFVDKVHSELDTVGSLFPDGIVVGEALVDPVIGKLDTTNTLLGGIGEGINQIASGSDKYDPDKIAYSSYMAAGGDQSFDEFKAHKDKVRDYFLGMVDEDGNLPDSPDIEEEVLTREIDALGNSLSYYNEMLEKEIRKAEQSGVNDMVEYYENKINDFEAAGTQTFNNPHGYSDAYLDANPHVREGLWETNDNGSSGQYLVISGTDRDGNEWSHTSTRFDAEGNFIGGPSKKIQENTSINRERLNNMRRRLARATDLPFEQLTFVMDNMLLEVSRMSDYDYKYKNVVADYMKLIDEATYQKLLEYYSGDNLAELMRHADLVGMNEEAEYYANHNGVHIGDGASAAGIHTAPDPNHYNYLSPTKLSTVIGTVGKYLDMLARNEEMQRQADLDYAEYLENVSMQGILDNTLDVFYDRLNSYYPSMITSHNQDYANGLATLFREVFGASQDVFGTENAHDLDGFDLAVDNMIKLLDEASNYLDQIDSGVMSVYGSVSENENVSGVMSVPDDWVFDESMFKDKLGSLANDRDGLTVPDLQTALTEVFSNRPDTTVNSNINVNVDLSGILESFGGGDRELSEQQLEALAKKIGAYITDETNAQIVDVLI